MDEKRSFGAYIRKKRQEAELTQRQLADILYVSESTVSKWERGLSYPDVALIPAVCQALHISEHEFFTACDDQRARDRERAARAWQGLTKGWQIFFAVSYGIALLVCFICDLAVFRRLDWFWIVLTGLMLAFCFTNLPFLVKKDRAAVCLGSATLSLALLLLSCWSFTRGGWWLLGALSITAAALALPWSVWAVRRFYGRHLAVLSMALLTVWTFALLTVIRIFTGGDWLLSLAFPIAALSLAFLWAGFAVVRWLPLGCLGKAGAVCLLAALAAPAGQGLACHLTHGEVPSPVSYLTWWRLVDMIRDGDLDWIDLLVFMLLVLLGAGLLLAGALSRRKQS